MASEVQWLSVWGEREWVTVRTERLPIIELMYYSIGVYILYSVIVYLYYGIRVFCLKWTSWRGNLRRSPLLYTIGVWYYCRVHTPCGGGRFFRFKNHVRRIIYIIFSSRIVFAENHTGRWLQKRQNVCVKNQQVTEVVAVVVVATDDLRQRVYPWIILLQLSNK